MNDFTLDNVNEMYIDAVSYTHLDVYKRQVDAPSIIATHLTEVIRSHIAELLTRQDVQNLVNNLKESSYLCKKLELIKCCKMNIRVIIDKLCPIQNSEIEFKPFLVYTGESGLGKSCLLYTSRCV